MIFHQMLEITMGPIRQATGPPRSGAGVGVGMLMVLWFYGSWFLWFDGFMVWWFNGLMVLWFYGFMVLWFCGFMVLWFIDLWFYGVVVLWFYGLWLYGSMALWFSEDIDPISMICKFFFVDGSSDLFWHTPTHCPTLSKFQISKVPILIKNQILKMIQWLFLICLKYVGNK